MAKTIQFNKENLLKLLPKNGRILPQTLKDAAIKLLGQVNTPQKSMTGIQFGVIAQINATVKELEKQGRTDKGLTLMYEGICYQNYLKTEPISNEFRDAENKMLTETNFLNDVDRWKKDFEVFGSGSETKDDINKGITAIRELQDAHNRRPWYTKFWNFVTRNSKEQDAINELKAKISESELLKPGDLDAALAQPKNPTYDVNNLTMSNPAHMAGIKEVEERLQKTNQKMDDILERQEKAQEFKEKERQEIEELEEQDRIEREQEEQHDRDFKAKHALWDTLPDGFMLDHKEIESLVYKSVPETIDFIVKKIEGMDLKSKEAYFNSIKAKDPNLNNQLKTADKEHQKELAEAEKQREAEATRQKKEAEERDKLELENKLQEQIRREELSPEEIEREDNPFKAEANLDNNAPQKENKDEELVLEGL